MEVESMGGGCSGGGGGDRASSITHAGLHDNQLFGGRPTPLIKRLYLQNAEAPPVNGEPTKGVLLQISGVVEVVAGRFELVAHKLSFRSKRP
jgi:hypothetical protein